MKNSAIFIIIGLLFLGSLTRCDNAADNYKSLKGSEWKAETDTTISTLHFNDDSTCSILAARKGEIFSANLTTYQYRFLSDCDSMYYFDVLLYQTNNDGDIVQQHYGYFVGKNKSTLKLTTPGIGYEMVCYFTKQ